MKKRSKLLLFLFLFVGVAILILQGAGTSSTAGSPPEIVLMRCVALDEPLFRYQVATISASPHLDLDITAGTESGEGDDCAAAIAHMAAQGVNPDRLILHATESALVVSLVEK